MQVSMVILELLHRLSDVLMDKYLEGSCPDDHCPFAEVTTDKSPQNHSSDNEPNSPPSTIQRSKEESNHETSPPS